MRERGTQKDLQWGQEADKRIYNEGKRHTEGLTMREKAHGRRLTDNIQNEGSRLRDLLLNDIGPLIPDKHHAIPAGTDELLLLGVIGKGWDGTVVTLLSGGQHSKARVLQHHASSQHLPAIMSKRWENHKETGPKRNSLKVCPDFGVALI